MAGGRSGARAPQRVSSGAFGRGSQKLSGAPQRRTSPHRRTTEGAAMEYYYAIVATVSGLSMVLYWNTLQADFAYDDRWERPCGIPFKRGGGRVCFDGIWERVEITAKTGEVKGSGPFYKLDLNVYKVSIESLSCLEILGKLLRLSHPNYESYQKSFIIVDSEAINGNLINVFGPFMFFLKYN